MEQDETADVHALMRLATMLRGYVEETSDPYYANLFLETADAIAQRINDLAARKPAPQTELRV